MTLHSVRSGLLEGMIEACYSEEFICRYIDWKSDGYREYLRTNISLMHFPTRSADRDKNNVRWKSSARTSSEAPPRPSSHWHSHAGPSGPLSPALSFVTREGAVTVKKKRKKTAAGRQPSVTTIFADDPGCGSPAAESGSCRRPGVAGLRMRGGAPRAGE
jgi:hypothetical protein